MPRLFSYVVEHDLGYGPNPSDGICTLAECKYSRSKYRKNIVELAEVGDWIAGTGGKNTKLSAGNGSLVYAMRVDDKIPLATYRRNYRHRIDADGEGDPVGRFALVSRRFCYFGKQAVQIARIPKLGLNHPFEKKGPGFRSKFNEEFIDSFVKWLESEHGWGVHGNPCCPHPKFQLHKCKPKLRHRFIRSC